MMPGFHRSNGWFARLNAFNEISLVVVGLVELDFVALGGNLAEPIHVGSIKATAVDPDPTFSADPFGAAFDIAMSTGDGHGDVIRILAGDPVLAAGIPDRGAGREFAGAFNFEGPAGLVAIQSPMGDITMVSNPIEQLTAADIIIPAPIHMDAHFDIGLHFRRANPGFIIEFGRRGGYQCLPVG